MEWLHTKPLNLTSEFATTHQQVIVYKWAKKIMRLFYGYLDLQKKKRSLYFWR
jgi:hypothetical protein